MRRVPAVCVWVGMEPVRNDILLEHTAQARDHDTWRELMEDALAPRKCNVIQSTSDEAPGLLASVEHHLGAHHSPDFFHVQHELSKAISAPLAVKQRAAAKTVVRAGETRSQVHKHLYNATVHPARHSLGRPPKVAASLAQVEPAVEAVRQEHCRLAGQREHVSQSMHVIGQAYHFVDLERGVRRHGTPIARDIQRQIDTIRTIASQEDLSQACLDRIENAQRVVPTMHAPIAFVSDDVRQQGR